MKKAKIYAMLICLALVATGLPSVSATATILTAVEDEDIYVFSVYNHTASDLSELLGITLNEDDTLYISYYNGSGDRDTGSTANDGTLNHTSITPTQDSNDIVWFNINFLVAGRSQINDTNRQVFFSDEAITDANFDEANTALCVNSSYSKTDFMYIATIPDGVEFTYGDYSFVYDDNNFTVNDEDGDEKGNLSSWEYNSTFQAYAMNLSDDDKSHQLVFYGDDLHATTTAISAKRITADEWYWFPTAVTYTMDAETTDEYNLFTSTDGYVAFDVRKDQGGYLGKYSGGATKFKMSADSFKYETTPWWHFGAYKQWTEITTHESEINGISVGIVEYIYLSEDTGEEDTDEIFKDNFGVVTSKGVATTVSGFDILKMWTSRTPEAVTVTRATDFA